MTIIPKHKTIGLILENHSWFKQPDKNVTYVLMEIRQETDYVTHHIQKVAAFFAGKKRCLMESFYRWMRKRYDILMDKDKPFGGQWNYDQKNRQTYDHQVPIPQPLFFNNDVSDIYKTNQNKNPAN